MLERAITTKDLTSRYYKHNLGLAEKWEAYSKEHNGNIEGIVNGAILAFNLQFQLNSIRVEIEGFRQRSNASMGTIHRSSMIKNIIIKLQPVSFGKDNWKIYQRNIWRDSFNAIIGNCEPFGIAPQFSITSKEKVSHQEVNAKLDFKFLSEIAEIRSVSFKNSEFRIEYFTLLGANTTEELLNKLVNNQLKSF
jgi:hypothetical protein